MKKRAKWTEYILVSDSMLDFSKQQHNIHNSEEKTVLFFSDLVPKENLEKWLNYLKKEFPTVAFKSATLLKDRNMVRALHADSHN